ncbi:hypothetical protein BALAC2494_02082 [Bifidobacterium animalis subsp. lactis CNCM I-2494]|uniref:Uncharacterized protein n=1 Tax=Bifidobacterium animalis subsp. lactis CNCM I-2494 TaxID=1042403 RepID=A0A806FJE2_BIFAN|nr:hypothetical protein BALAC2494_02082 [Bifidobacterium animalis subsp. lactis CNCM I-2494]
MIRRYLLPNGKNNSRRIYSSREPWAASEENLKFNIFFPREVCRLEENLRFHIFFP